MFSMFASFPILTGSPVFLLVSVSELDFGIKSSKLNEKKNYDTFQKLLIKKYSRKNVQVHEILNLILFPEKYWTFLCANVSGHLGEREVGAYKSLPSLKFNEDLYRVFLMLKMYIYILQMNAVIIEGYVAFYVKDDSVQIL